MKLELFQSPTPGDCPIDLTQCSQASLPRPADWRWQLALGRAIGDLELSSSRLDRPTCRAIKLFKKLLAAKSPAAAEQAWARWPAIRDAMAIRRAGGWPQAELESWLLTGATSSLVAARTNLPLETVKAYRRYHYDLAGRSTSQLLTEIINSPLAVATESTLHRAVREFALRWGRQMLERILDLDVPNMQPVSLADIQLFLSDVDDRKQWMRYMLAVKCVDWGFAA